MTNTVSTPKKKKKIQKHVIVGIRSINMVNNYKCLPAKWVDEKNSTEITVLEKSVKEKVSSFIDKGAFDITVSPKFVDDLSASICFGFNGVNKDTATLYRYPKPIQSLFFKKAKELISEKDSALITVPSFEFSKEGDYKLPYMGNDSHPGPDEYLIKPVAGARSIGILSFQADTHCPKTIHKKLKDSTSFEDFKKRIEEEWVNSNIVSNGVLNFDVFLQSMDKLDEEGYLALVNQGFYIQEKVNVRNEWRVIFQIKDILKPELGYEFYVFNRDHGGKKLDPRNFTHVKEGFDKTIACSETRTSVHNYLTTLLRESKQLFGSLDLFKDANGKYGVFEFSNQFGMEDNNAVFFEKLHKAFIEKIVNAAL